LFISFDSTMQIPSSFFYKFQSIKKKIQNFAFVSNYQIITYLNKKLRPNEILFSFMFVESNTQVFNKKCP